MELFADLRDPGNEKVPDSSIVDASSAPWRVLLVDDDQQMHQITQIALNGFEFQGRGLELVSAYSAAQAKDILEDNHDIAVALIDVVMETEHAGLELVHHIRTERENRLTRLVLRTGQAGQAPEDIVIREYEIDDYKEKTELTTQKLRTLLYSSLRAYRDICLIEDQKQGLSRVIEASANVQNTGTLKTYATSVLEQLTSLLKLEASAFYCIVQPSNEGEETRALTLAATGEYVQFHPKCSFDLLPNLVSERCQISIDERKSISYDDAYVFYTIDDRNVKSILYINLKTDLSELDKQLLELYMQNICLTFENINLMVDLQDTAKELVYNLANAVEARSKETGAHVQRVALISEHLGLLYGLSEADATMIKHASPLHDVGKVAIPDSILHKPGKLTKEEWEIMQKHVDYGVEILSNSKRRLMLMAKEIAGHHHEKWDGSGYPNKMQGEEIPISGRLTAIADVFDALGSKRSYKEPWSNEDIRTEIANQRGKHFDPKLVDLMLEHWDAFIAIRARFPD
jgi:response regulator RpfG family c-di-GMP phosphodiesterase